MTEISIDRLDPTRSAQRSRLFRVAAACGMDEAFSRIVALPQRISAFWRPIKEDGVAMKTLIVSCLEQVPHLVERFHPDRLLSIAAVPETPGYMNPSQHRVLNFADIDTPTRTNLRFAAKPEDIEVIRSLKDDETVLINCRLGQRRSPTAALIVLWALYPGREQEWVERIQAQAPYVEFNRWMLRLVDPQRASLVPNRPRVLPPKGCFLVLEPDAMDGSKDPRSE